MTQLAKSKYQLSVQTYKDLRIENQQRQVRNLSSKDFNSEGGKFSKLISTLYGFRADLASLVVLKKQLATSKLFNIYSFQELEYMFQVANEDGYLERSTDFGKDVVNASLMAKVVNHYKKTDEYQDAKSAIIKEQQKIKTMSQESDRLEFIAKAQEKIVDAIISNGDIASDKKPVFRPNYYDFMVKHFHEPTTDEKRQAMTDHRETAIAMVMAKPISGRLDRDQHKKAIDNETKTLAKKSLFFDFCLNNEMTKQQMMDKVKQTK